jgi:signal transduction histidine kinase
MLPLAFTLARAVVERNGGSLGVASQPGGGTLLELRLPPSPADS